MWVFRWVAGIGPIGSILVENRTWGEEMGSPVAVFRRWLDQSSPMGRRGLFGAPVIVLTPEQWRHHDGSLIFIQLSRSPSIFSCFLLSRVWLCVLRWSAFLSLFRWCMCVYPIVCVCVNLCLDLWDEWWILCVCFCVEENNGEVCCCDNLGVSCENSLMNCVDMLFYCEWECCILFGFCVYSICVYLLIVWWNRETVCCVLFFINGKWSPSCISVYMWL